MLEVVVKKVGELEQDPAFTELVREYAEESSLAGLPPIDEKLAAYKALDASPIYKLYAAYYGDQLVGFVSVITPVLPHYGVAITVAESLFVGKKYRALGAGLLLIRTAEAHARASKSPGLLFSSPTGGRLADVLPHIGYHETNRVFLKSFSNE